MEAKSDVFDYIEGFYNRTRRHSHLGLLSPLAFEQLHYVHIAVNSAIHTASKAPLIQVQTRYLNDSFSQPTNVSKVPRADIMKSEKSPSQAVGTSSHLCCSRRLIVINQCWQVNHTV